MVSCRHVICYQCDDENAKVYRELLVDVARKIDQLGCNLVDLPKLVEEALMQARAKSHESGYNIGYEIGYNIGNDPNIS